MVSARGIRAGAAYIELYVNDNRLVRGLKRAQARLKAFSASVRQVVIGLVALSAVFATPLIAGVKAFGDFEEQMANVYTMLDEPAKHIDRFRKGVRDMSVECSPAAPGWELLHSRGRLCHKQIQIPKCTSSRQSSRSSWDVLALF